MRQFFCANGVTCLLEMLNVIGRKTGVVATRWSHGVMVSTLDSESSDPNSNLGGTFLPYSYFYFIFYFAKETKLRHIFDPTSFRLHVIHFSLELIVAIAVVVCFCFVIGCFILSDIGQCVCHLVSSSSELDRASMHCV